MATNKDPPALYTPPPFTTPATHPNHHYWASNDIWAALTDPSKQLFSDLYCDQDPLTAGLYINGKRGGCYVEQTLKNEKGISKKGWTVSDNLNLLINLPEQRTLWFKKQNHGFKIQYDNAAHKLAYLGSANIYAALTSSWGLKNSSFKFGLTKIVNKFTFDCRYRFNLSETGRTQQYGYLKTESKFNENITLGSLKVYNFTKNVFQKNDFFIAAKVNEENLVTLKLESEGFRDDDFKFSSLKDLFDSVHLTYLYTRSKNLQLAFRTVLSVENKNLRSVEAAIQTELKDNIAKAKLDYTDRKAGIAAVIKNKFNEFVNLSLGCSVKDLLEKRQVNIGFRCDLYQN